jgi:hypothetical protein
VLFVSSGLYCLSVDAPAAAAADSPSTLVTQAMANAKTAGWVHEEIRASGLGHSFSAHNDIGTSEGRQEIDSDGSVAAVVDIRGAAYIRANAQGVAKFFQLPTADPNLYADKWIAVTPADADYGAVIDALTLQSDFSHIQILGPYSEGAAMELGGHKVVPVRGFVSGGPGHPKVHATLYVTTKGKVLPVQLTESATSVKETEKWSNWGHAVSLVAPVGAVPFPAAAPTAPTTPPGGPAPGSTAV